MIRKNPVIKGRVRQIKGSFAWIPHEFLRRGFRASLNHHELPLYLFLVLVADRQGISYYSFDKICSLISITPDEYIEARNGLTGKNLIAFDGHLFQVLSLPEELASSLKAGAGTLYFWKGRKILMNEFAKEIEIIEIDTRFEFCRLKNRYQEDILLRSILQSGIRDPLLGLKKPNDSMILLDGFKRLRCLKKLKIHKVPVKSLGEDEVSGILQFIRLSNPVV